MSIDYEGVRSERGVMVPAEAADRARPGLHALPPLFLLSALVGQALRGHAR